MVVTWLIELARCPKCGSSFDVKVEEKEPVSQRHSDVIKGTLVCKKCKASYQITDGVPVFVD